MDKNMVGLNERIKELRTILNLTQTEFGAKLGLARNTIACYEASTRVPNDATLKLICRTFNVDYFWLTEGINEPFIEMPETTLDEIILEYDLDEKDKAIMKTYINLPDQDREAVKRFLEALTKNLQKEKDKE